MRTVEHKVGALIGPNGELAIGWCDPEKLDWGMLWDATEGWPCEETDIRRACITIRVPVYGPPEHTKIAADSVEIIN